MSGNIAPFRPLLINSYMPDKQLSPPETLDERLYQLIISRLNGDAIDDAAYREKIIGLVRKGIGGFIVFGGKREEVREFIRMLQSLADIPLFIASDIERGVEQQIKGTTPFPCPMAVAAALHRESPEDMAVLEDAVRAVAEEAIDIGINMPLIPVMDVNQNPDNPIICTRAFSDDPAKVARLGTRYIKVLEQSGLISCAKHFPGHGDTSTDSHIALPVITKPYEDLMDRDVMPFIEAIKAGTRSIMIGHLTVPALDMKPASLSGRVITDLLRKELGFEGLVLTDALNMNALDAFGRASVECIKAGADMLLHPSDADATVEELRSAIGAKHLGERQITVAVSRILHAKANLERRPGAEVDYEGHHRLSVQLVERSITLVKDTPGLLPLSEKERGHLMYAGDTVHGVSPLREYFRDVVPLGGAGQYEGDTLIVALFTSVAAWKGSSGIDESAREYIAELIKRSRKSVVISFGSPYVLRYFNKAGILIAAYEGTGQAQEAVLRCLRGASDFRGRLPVAF